MSINPLREATQKSWCCMQSQGSFKLPIPFCPWTARSRKDKRQHAAPKSMAHLKGKIAKLTSLAQSSWSRDCIVCQLSVNPWRNWGIRIKLHNLKLNDHMMQDVLNEAVLPPYISRYFKERMRTNMRWNDCLIVAMSKPKALKPSCTAEVASMHFAYVRAFHMLCLFWSYL